MNFENWFIKNDDLLFETCKINDLLDLSSNVIEFSSKLDKIKFNSIFWLIWNFWEGKSTLINNVKIYRQTNTPSSDYWIEFDSWKYPDRKNLWEWFVLDFAKQVDDKAFEKARKSIDWENNYDKETLMKTMGGALSAFIPWWGIVSNLAHFFRSSPAKRVFEIQEILIELIKKIKKEKIFIVVEDIDRSWDNGIFFLETLKQFISTNDFWKQIVVIVPIGTKEYEKNIDSYLKPIDYFDTFQIKEPWLEKFIKEVFIDDIVNKANLFLPLKDFLEWLFKYYPNDINLRKLKLILRKANHNHMVMYWKYDSIFNLDWRLNIIFETTKYIKGVWNGSSIFENIKDWGKIISNSLIWAYIYNLYSFPNWSINKYYGWNNISIFELIYNSSLNKDEIKLHVTSTPIELNDKITEKDIVWWWFELNSFKKYVVPLSYINY